MNSKRCKAHSKKGKNKSYPHSKIKKIKNIFTIGGLTLWLIINTTGKKLKAAPPLSPPSVTSVKPGENVPFNMDESKKFSRRLHWPGISHTFLERNPEKEEVEFSPWGLLAPIQLEGSRTIEEEKEADITIPYEYAQLFNSAKELNPGDKQKVIDYIDQELKKEFADDLIGLEWSKRVYRVDHSIIPKDLKVKSITIKGTTSPEGPREHGPDAIKPGNVSQKNIGLGEKRAKDVSPIMIEYLQNQGISAKSLGLATQKITSEEIQFTENDFAIMEDIADKLVITGGDELDKIHNLIIDYNDGKITDQDALRQLDSIIANKRSVRVHMVFEAEYDQTLLIPIPIFLFLPLLGLRRRKDEIIENISEKVLMAELPPPDSQEYEKMQEATVIDDIYKYIDDPETIKKGINYRSHLQQMEARYNKLKNDQDRENVLTIIILEDWEKHDKAVREKAGLKDPETSHGYKDNSEQIKWAKIHARELLDMVKQKREAKNDQLSYDEILRNKYNTLLKKRLRREQQSR